MKKILLAVVVCSLVLSIGFGAVGAASAGAATPTLKSLAKSVAALQKKTKTLSTQLAAAKKTVASQGATIASQGQTIASLQSKLTADEATISSLSATVAGHTQTLTSAASLLAIAPYVRLDTTTINGVKPPNIIFQGANVHVRSATSETDSTGTGNLIVGWNNAPGTVARNGSNNLVAGDYNNFNSYAGFVCGIANSLNQHYCSVSGGNDNAANAEYSSISGGGFNSTNGFHSSISGGRYNNASGSYTSILGGGGAVSGYGNTASGDYSTLCGGRQNSVGTSWSTVGGGYGVSISSWVDAWAAGGSTQTMQYLTHN